VILLDDGDPDFDTPPHIVSALYKAAKDGHTHYADHRGDAELRSLLAEVVTRRAWRQYGSEEILVTHGATAALSAVLLALSQPGAQILIPNPTYPLYADLARLAGLEVIYVPPAQGFRLDMAAIESRARGARFIVFCNPCNPTGTVLTRGDLECLAEIAERHNLIVIADEAYDQLVFEPTTFTTTLAIPALQSRLIYIQTFSKSYAMCGWRIGYLAAEREVVDATLVVHENLNGPINSSVQRAAIAALTTPNMLAGVMREEYRRRRDIVCALTARVPHVRLDPPEATFYAFFKYMSAAPSWEVARAALACGVAVRPGSSYGPHGEGHVRAALCCRTEVLPEAMNRLLRVLSTSS
jgi:aspartate/methionine/tyrosine aminotransferase